MLRFKKLAEKLLACSFGLAALSVLYVPTCHVFLGDGELESLPDENTGRNLMKLLKSSRS